jgi:hypothetical protein
LTLFAKHNEWSVSHFPAVALESTRGWRIAKEKTSHKIDIVVALAQAALAVVRKGQESWIRQGAIGPDGRITWRDEKKLPTRFRVVRITEQQDLKQRGLL